MKRTFIFAMFLLLLFVVGCSQTTKPTETTLVPTTHTPTTETLYKVTFNSMGGSDIEPLFIEKGSTIPLPNPVREGYIFMG